MDDKALEAAFVAGWNACRKSVYAVCEDVGSEADRIRIKGPVGTHSEEQHAKGYHAGMHRAAKSIARGFNSMEALDDDNLRAAIAAYETGWRSMDSAPKDGAFVLLYWPTMPINWFPAVGFSHGDEYGWELAVERDFGEIFPTLWCPIPSLPSPLPSQETRTATDGQTP